MYRDLPASANPQVVLERFAPSKHTMTSTISPSPLAEEPLPEDRDELELDEELDEELDDEEDDEDEELELDEELRELLE